jgi:hypothetical protein
VYFSTEIGDRKGIESEKGVTSAFQKAIKQGCSVVILDLDFNLKKLREKRLSKFLNWRKDDFISGRIKECYVVCDNKAVVITREHQGCDAIADALKK